MLIILFQCHQDLGQYQECISFLNLVTLKQPLLASHCLIEDDLATITARQTDALLKSQSVMFEVLRLNEAQEEPGSETDQFF